jgi:hypothetical protein
MNSCGIIRLRNKKDNGKVLGNATLIGPTKVLTTVKNILDLKDKEPYTHMSFTSLGDGK